MERSSSGPGSLLTPEFLAELRQLQIQMRRNSQESLSGQYRSAFRGSGMEFEEVREYVPGDEIRRIDWKVTARFQRPFVKSYREERELHVVIAVDVSPSTWTGTRTSLRRDVLLRSCAALASVAIANGDKVGFLTFADQVVRYRRPQKSRNATWSMLHEILSDEQSAQHPVPRTDIGAALLFLGKVLKRRSVVFLLSDFFASGYEEQLGGLSKRHDVTAVVVSDPADLELPNTGYTRLRDPETGVTHLLDCSDPRLRARYRELSERAESERTKKLSLIGVDTLPLSTDTPLIRELVLYFRSRMAKQKHSSALQQERKHGRR